jgi:hypothetical protein
LIYVPFGQADARASAVDQHCVDRARLKLMMQRLHSCLPAQNKSTTRRPAAYFGPLARHAEADAIHVSAAFSHDKGCAEHLAEQWRRVAPDEIGGVANGDRAPRSCPASTLSPATSSPCAAVHVAVGSAVCEVRSRSPAVADPDGWNVLDYNLLACPRPQVEAVFAMPDRIYWWLGALSLQD